MRALTVTVVLLGGLVKLWAQIPDQGTTSMPDTLWGAGMAVLTVSTSPPGATIYLDSILLRTPTVDRIPLTAGTHVITAVSPDSRAWMSVSRSETLDVLRGEVIVRTIRLPRVYHFTSDPSGASVTIGDSTIGRTPLIVELDASRSVVGFDLRGFETVRLPIGEGAANIHAVLPAQENLPPDLGPLHVEGAGRPDALPLYLTAGAAVVSGVAAAMMKDHADDLYAGYRQTGDPDQLHRVRRYDTMSGIALASCEVNLFVLAYLLFSR